MNSKINHLLWLWLLNLAALVCHGQDLDLPFHWRWRDYGFPDSLVHLSELEVITLSDKGGHAGELLSYHWIKFDSLGRSVEENLLKPGEFSATDVNRFRWVYDSTGCPQRFILLSGSYFHFPSSRYHCEEGKLIQEKAWINNGYAIKRYQYDEELGGRPAVVVLYKGTGGWPYDKFDALDYRYDFQGRLSGYIGEGQQMLVAYADGRTDFTLDEDRGPITKWRVYFGDHGIPFRIMVLRKGWISQSRQTVKRMYFRPVWR